MLALLVGELGATGHVGLLLRFSFDGGEPSGTDRRVPYRATFRLPFAAGTRHVDCR